MSEPEKNDQKHPERLEDAPEIEDGQDDSGDDQRPDGRSDAGDPWHGLNDFDDEA